MSIFEKNKKNKKFVVRPRLWKILLSRVAALLLVGVVVSGVLVGFYNSKLKEHVDTQTAYYIELLEDDLRYLEWNHPDYRDYNNPQVYAALLPVDTGRYVRVYRDGELIDETKPCVWLRIESGTSYNAAPLHYIVDINEIDLPKNEMASGFNSKVMYTGLFAWDGSYFDMPFDIRASVFGMGFGLLDGDTTLAEISSEYGIDINSDYILSEFEKAGLFGLLLDYERVATEADYKKGMTYSFTCPDMDGGMHKYDLEFSRNVYMRNAFDNTGVTMYLIIAFVLVVCILVGCIWAILSYFSLKNMYSAYMYRSDLTNKLAHDLKTPLMAISSMAETYKGSSNFEKKDHYVDTIAENARYMDSLITQTLELASSEAGGSEVNKESFDIKNLVEEVCALFESKIATNRLMIDMSSLEVKTINSDRMRLKNAITCLMDNAVKYAPEGSVIVVGNSGASGGSASGGSAGGVASGASGGAVSGSASGVAGSVAGGSCVVSITNEYKGQIDNVKTLTEPYVRGDKSRSTKGSGLGLAIADSELKNLGFSLNLKADGGKFTAVVK